MNLLLETHAFVWWDSDPGQLSEPVLNLLRDRRNVFILSVVSVWEIQVKLQLGKLRLGLPLGQIVERQREANGVEILAVTLLHVLAVGDLPDHHRDPFDRLLVAQAMVEGLTLVTRDAMILRYSVDTFW